MTFSVRREAIPTIPPHLIFDAAIDPIDAKGIKLPDFEEHIEYIANNNFEEPLRKNKEE